MNKKTINRKVYVALPVMDELDYLEDFIHCISKQTIRPEAIYICINQPDKWWDHPNKFKVCEHNYQAFLLFKKLNNLPVILIDRFSRGKGWKGKHYGVGWARKVTMDAISNIAGGDDIIVSVDADTYYPPDYLESVVRLFARYPERIGISNPFYHRMTGEDKVDRAMLRYEIYMRNYSLNMWKIRNPYSYSALGSAISVPVWAYRKIGGITPHKSGEDFYFLQKLSKTGALIQWNPVKVFPAARPSERVFFGTGPAIIKGMNDNWSSYPVYHYSLFEKVKQTYDLFPELFTRDLETPMDGFLRKQFNDENIWDLLRNNSASKDTFIKACTHKIDGLRILQFLKSEQPVTGKSDEECFVENKTFLFKDEFNNNFDIKRLNFRNSDIETLSDIRDLMVEKEDLILRSSQKVHG